MSVDLPLIDAELLSRLQAGHAAYLRAGWEAVAAEPGNPHGLEVRSFGSTLACRAPGLADVAPYNRALLLGDGERLDDLLAWFGEADLGLTIELGPAEIHEPLARRLAAAGLFQTGFLSVVYGRPQTDLEVSRRIRTVELGPERLDLFVDLWSQGLSRGAEWRVELVGLWRRWFTMPGFRLYLASYDEIPAAIAGLWCADGLAQLHGATTMLEYRGLGCQAALLCHRLADATAAGCDLVTAETSHGSAGHRNLQRAGLELATIKALWRRDR